MSPFPPLREVHPARANSARDLPALETALAGLALDDRSPIALELAATTTTRHFVLRAEQTVALRYLEQQIQARYPQALITMAPTDPLAAGPGEEWSVLELRPGAAAYLPLRSWKTRDLTTEGTDPLLGILAAFGTLPAEVRAVAQLALLPASPTWSSASRRYAVEHPLARERNQARGTTQGHTIKDVLLLLPLGLVSLLFYGGSHLLPAWVRQVAGAVLHGQGPQLTPLELLSLVGGGLAALVLVLGLAFGGMVLVAKLGRPRLYDQRLVEEKTARPAYRVCLRLFVFAPGEHLADENDVPLVESATDTDRRKRWSRLLVSVGAALRAMDTRGQVVVEFRQIWQRQRALSRARREHARAARSRRQMREDILRMLAASYRQYHLASGGYFVPCWLSARQSRRVLAVPARRWFWRVGWSADVFRSRHYLSVADLAALWHLPQAPDLADLAYVERRTMRTLLAPSVLATVAGYPLGTSTHAGQTLPVVLPFACLLQNFLAAASTGKGKSSLFFHLMQAYALGRQLQRTDCPDGALLIDPHGDLVALVAAGLPADLVDDVVVIDLADRDFPVGFNPLDMVGGKDRDKCIDNLILVIEALWPSSYGPRTESILEYSCKTLAEANLALIASDPLTGPDRQFTLLDVVPLLRQTSFRHAVLELVTDPHLVSWWHHYYELLDGRQQADFTSSLITKIAKFSSSKIISRIVGQPRSTLDLPGIIQQNKIVLFSCASGEVGSDMAALFGSVFVGFFQSALQEQARLRPQDRHRFLVLIDEFQTLAGINYQSMLAELRKYGGSFALATQSMAYLDRFERTLRATVLANAEHIFAFAMADEDARLLRLPGIEPEDVTQLPNYTCYARLALGGERLPVFSLHLAAPEQGDSEVLSTIRARSRARYGRAVGDVEQILREGQARRDLAGSREPAEVVEPAWIGPGKGDGPTVLANIRKRKRGSGSSKKGGSEQAGGLTYEPGVPEHALYDPWSDEQAQEGER